MRKALAALTLLLLCAALAQATLPVIENVANREGLIVTMKRKGYAGSTTTGDTLYFGATTTDSSIVYYTWPLTSIQTFGYATGNDSCNYKVTVYNGLASTASYGSLTKMQEFNFYGVGAQEPILLAIPGPMLMLTVSPIGASGKDSRVQITLTRSTQARTSIISTTLPDTSTRNAPGNFPGVPTKGFTCATFFGKIIRFATSVTIVPEGYYSKLGIWASLDAENDSTTIADSTFVRTFPYTAGFDSLRVRWHSEAGGTDHAMTVGIKLTNPER